MHCLWFDYFKSLCQILISAYFYLYERILINVDYVLVGGFHSMQSETY